MLHVVHVVEDVLAGELLPNERLLWSGQPDLHVHLIFTPADLFLVPFSLLWGGFAFSWGTTVLRLGGGSPGRGTQGPELSLVLWGLPFVAVGLYLVLGRFLYRAWRRKRPFYAVTDRRVLILTRLWSTGVQSLYIDQLPGVQKSVRANGTGTLVFCTPSFWGTTYADLGIGWFGLPRGQTAPAFYGIADCVGVDHRNLA